PDYQYTPLLVTAMASMIAYGVYDAVLGSRIIGGTALRGGMPLYKYVANRLLTAFENLFLRVKLSEYHTGYRAFSREVLTRLPLGENSDDFVFDNQMLAQCVYFGFHIGEVSCPTKYFKEASSINFRRSVQYGFGVLATTLQFALQRAGILHNPIFSDKGKTLEAGSEAYYEGGLPATSPRRLRTRGFLIIACATESPESCSQTHPRNRSAPWPANRDLRPAYPTRSCWTSAGRPPAANDSLWNALLPRRPIRQCSNTRPGSCAIHLRDSARGRGSRGRKFHRCGRSAPG